MSESDWKWVGHTVFIVVMIVVLWGLTNWWFWLGDAVANFWRG